MRNEQIKQFRFGLLSSISISCLKLCCATWLGCKINNGQLSVFLKSALLLVAPLEELVFPYSNFQLNPTTKTIALSSETKVPVVFFPADDILKKMAPERLPRSTFWWAPQLPFSSCNPTVSKSKSFTFAKNLSLLLVNDQWFCLLPTHKAKTLQWPSISNH